VTAGFGFAVEHRAPDGPARAGRLTTPHGEVETPVFMAVGTRASVKGLTPEQVRAAGTRIVLANTYHLHLRPGEDVVRELGGLHRFMGWDGPILTDSGGYQVFSLADLRSIDDTGVRAGNIGEIGLSGLPHEPFQPREEVVLPESSAPVEGFGDDLYDSLGVPVVAALKVA